MTWKVYFLADRENDGHYDSLQTFDAGAALAANLAMNTTSWLC
jgi:hypothetical protein